jgi:hypothetical protein
MNVSLAAGREPQLSALWRLHCSQSVIKRVINDNQLGRFPQDMAEGFDQHNFAVIPFYLLILKLNTQLMEDVSWTCVTL